MLLDPQTGKTEMVESDPLGKVDLGGALFSQSTDELIETWYIAARAKTYFKDKAYGADYRWLEKQYPDKEIRSRLQHARRTEVAGDVLTAIREPGKTILFDRKDARSRRSTASATRSRARAWPRCGR